MTERIAGRYELSSTPKEGPLAGLYRARLVGASTFRPRVAVRALHPSLGANARFVSTWASVATSLARASSPRVERLIDVVVDGASSYFVTEWIEGASVATWLAAYQRRDLPVPWPLAVEIAIEVLRGLREAHAMKEPIVHGGIVPEALRMGRDGTVRITRFGATEAFRRTGASRHEMQALGLEHPSPERARGEIATPATDLYGVGVLLFELLSSSPMLDVPVGDSRDERLQGEPPDLTRARDDLPPLLVAHVERALRPEAEERFASADLMVRALAQLLRSHPSTVGPEALARSSQELEIPEGLDDEDDAPTGGSPLAISVQRVRERRVSEAAASLEEASATLAAALATVTGEAVGVENVDLPDDDDAELPTRNPARSSRRGSDPAIERAPVPSTAAPSSQSSPDSSSSSGDAGPTSSRAAPVSSTNAGPSSSSSSQPSSTTRASSSSTDAGPSSSSPPLESSSSRASSSSTDAGPSSSSPPLASSSSRASSSSPGAHPSSSRASSASAPSRDAAATSDPGASSSVAPSDPPPDAAVDADPPRASKPSSSPSLDSSRPATSSRSTRGSSPSVVSTTGSSPTGAPLSASRPPPLKPRAERSSSAPPEVDARGSSPSRAPVGLKTAQRTMHVDLADLTELAPAQVIDDAAASEPPPGPASEPPPEELAGESIKPDRTQRYDFSTRKKSLPRRRARRLVREDSAPAPLPLTRVARPPGLTPSNTDIVNVDDLEEVIEAVKTQPVKTQQPRGIPQAKTEFLDEDQVDRLTLPPERRPSGLTPAKTEFLDEDEVDRLEIDD